MTKKQKKMRMRIIIAAVLLVVVTILENMIEIPIIVAAVLYLIPYFVIGYDILKKAWKGIRNRQVFDENFLMAVATIGALCLGDFRESVAVMLFYQIGELFQSCAVGKSRRSIAELMDIRPDYANVMQNGKLVQVPPSEVEVGASIFVQPGERVPIDGVIVQGDTMLDTSALTGESIPRKADCGSEIMSGCINMSAVVEVRTTKAFGESTVQKILDLVENSSMKKSRSENFITRFAKYYTPVVCYAALALAILPPVISLLLGLEANWIGWLTRALTFLVISCPCALVISIPLSFFGGIGCASRHGILIKGSNYLESLAKTNCIVFDKTGTLTKGVFEVNQIIPEEGYSPEELLYFAAYAESGSKHPIAESLRRCYQEDIVLEKVEKIEEIAGFGVKAIVDGKSVVAGNRKLMEKMNGYSCKIREEGTMVYIAIENQYAGCITISDQIKETSKDAISELKKSGIRKTIMLTGDSKETANRIAKELDFDYVESELLPDDKVNAVEKLLAQKQTKEMVAFVGDGMNDAPVLSRVDIGIAMGAMGSDAAIEAADLVLMDDDPKKISLAMRISRKTLRIVKENIVIALAVKGVCLILGAFGIANMWLAIFADVGVMVIAVFNAMRTLRIS